jgi:hypothetical protein
LDKFFESQKNQSWNSPEKIRAGIHQKKIRTWNSPKKSRLEFTPNNLGLEFTYKIRAAIHLKKSGLEFARLFKIFLCYKTNKTGPNVIKLFQAVMYESS